MRNAPPSSNRQDLDAGPTCDSPSTSILRFAPPANFDWLIPMPDQATLNHAAQVLATISTDQRADTALRFYFERHRYLQPPARRHISHLVFVYFRWLSWLDAKASPQGRLEQAAQLQERFTKDPKSIKPETLAVRAVPDWL